MIHNKVKKMLVISIFFISCILCFVIPEKTFSTIETTLEIDTNKDKYEDCNVAAVDEGNGQKSYCFYSDDLTDALGKMVPYKTAGNIFVGVPDEYRESITNELVESVDQYFANEKFSITERGNATSPAKFSGYRTLYSTKDSQIYTEIDEEGIIHNVVVHFVPADKIKYTEMGIVEGSITFNADYVFDTKEEALNVLMNNKAYPKFNVYESEVYSFGNEQNSIILLDAKDVYKLSSYRPKMIVNENNECISEGIHVITWILDDEIFANPITWYEIFVGVSEDVYMIDDLKTEDPGNKENISDNTNNNVNSDTDKKINKINPIALVLILSIATFLYRTIIRYIKNKISNSDTENYHYEYYSNNNSQNNGDIIDVEYREIEDD